MIISYGGHGGGKAAEQLKQVCQGLRMSPLDNPVCLTFPDKEFIAKVGKGEDLDMGVAFKEYKAEIRMRFKELVSSIAL